ncbi:MAG: CDP-diacylglycerol--serine O-phosphatidyltransferase [Candidatus Woesearchaeota archaeon]
MRIYKFVKVADFFTIGNLCCGVLSVLLAYRLPHASALLILAAALFDHFDGKVARLLKQQNEFGKQLDSLADVVSFGVAPAVLYSALASQSWIGTVLLLTFVTCGMLRLARYNVCKRKGFEGVPITVNGLLFPGLYLLFLFFPKSLACWQFAFALMSVLMVSSIRLRRLF